MVTWYLCFESSFMFQGVRKNKVVVFQKKRDLSNQKQQNRVPVVSEQLNKLAEDKRINRCLNTLFPLSTGQ